jgi:hypothetical protein
MICNHCGKQNDDTSSYCNFCKSLLKVSSENDKRPNDIHRFETDLGFSSPNSSYIGPLLQEEQKHQDDSDSTYTSQGDIPSEYQGNAEQIKAFFDEKYPDQRSITIDESINEPACRELTRKRKRKQMRKQLLIISIPVFIILVAMAVILFPSKPLAHNSESYYLLPDNALELYNHENRMYFFNSEGDILHQFEGKGYVQFNQDKTAAIITLGGKYYYISADKLHSLNASMNEIKISDNGKFVIYPSNLGSKDSLYLYDVEKETEMLITQSEDRMLFGCNVSNDGRNVIYSTYQIGDTLAVEAYKMKLGDEPELIGKNMLVLAMSQDADYLYYFELSKENDIAGFYVRHNENDVKLSYEPGELIQFNRDYSEVMYSDGNNMYLSIKGGEPVLIANTDNVRIITPKQCEINSNLYWGGMLCNIDSFQNKVMLLDNRELRLIDKHYNAIEINTRGQESVADYCSLSKDGNELIYRTVGSSVIRVKNLTGNFTKEAILEKVEAVEVSDDFSKLYYIKDGQLFYNNKGYSAKEIMEDVSQVVLNREGDIAFFRKGNKVGPAPLYYSMDGSSAQPIKGFEEVTDLMVWNQGILVNKRVNGVITSYYNKEDTEFELLLEQENILSNITINPNYQR